MAVEGVDQLETYFGSYLPQFFYAMLAPLTLFGVLSFVNFPAALVLFLCVPLIPAAIVACSGGPRSCSPNTGGSTPPWATPSWRTCKG